MPLFASKSTGSSFTSDNRLPNVMLSARTSSDEQNEATAKCRLLSREIDNNGPKVLRSGKQA
ncbi:hypothetical protein N2605_25510 [Bradyrhizobium yuanmingense]|uniref:hypothetical protein n=1 Tax=Bradyrhizobium yuanmingense TaxID=108015 RepID=UPI0021A6B9EF|nr:hypothetical protein [Bradyrhizobium sp. CB1024]UWU82927.1 hypothetical protein N2605_25510 [Bradyrhizobium sp. CB1024]